MSNYKKIPIWENRKREKSLIEFRSSVIEYFNNETIELRTQINRHLSKNHDYIIEAGINPLLNLHESLSMVRIASGVDAFDNIFNLDNLDTGHQQIIDLIDRAIGVYNRDKMNSWIRTFNPLFWLSRIIEYIVSIPFRFLGGLGLNRKKIENSLPGRIAKGILIFISYLATFLTVLEKVGWLSPVKNWVNNFIK